MNFNIHFTSLWPFKLFIIYGNSPSADRMSQDLENQRSVSSCGVVSILVSPEVIMGKQFIFNLEPFGI